VSTTKRFGMSAVVLTGCIVVSMIGAGGAAWAANEGRTTHARVATPAAAPTLPQTAAADRAATWLASKVNSHGYVVSSGTPDLSDTTLTILALAATKTQLSVARRALSYVEHNVDAYVNDGGSVGPGQLATLILDAHALGVNPHSFGGTNLVQRLLATLQTSGPNAGLFGAQDPTYNGAYRQGLALAALAAVGERAASEVGPAVEWLRHQQCAGGGWEAYRTSTATPCSKSDPTTYSGPDTNSTALAIEGLVAQHAAIAINPRRFFESLQASNGGWGYYGGPADPDSTSLVIQALLALHDSVSTSPFLKGEHDAVSALLSFRLSNGAFYYPGSHTANGLSTEQAVPALAMKVFPF
jgi:hypothetical protein